MNTTPDDSSPGAPLGPGGRAELAGRYLVEVGGSAPSVDVGQAAGCSNSTRRTEMLRLMRAEGWIGPGRGTVRLSAEGWARWSAMVPDVSAGPVLDRALAGWPYAHRAFLELLLSAIVARHHLGDVHPDTHLGFMALGETGTGKSAMAELVVRLLGLDASRVVVDLPAQSAGSVLGRRERVDGTWRLVPNAATRQQFLFFDEVDKADPDVRRATLSYFQGKRHVAVDGDIHELLPTAMMAANPPTGRGGAAGGLDRYALLRPEYRRRSVVLDTGYMRGRGEQIRQAMRAVQSTDPGTRPHLNLARLVPPDQQLSATGEAVLQMLREVLTAAGREEFDVRFLAIAALGRAALMGTRDHTLAAYATGCSYLWATETVPGQVLDGWVLPVDALREHLGAEAGVLIEAMTRARQGREQRLADEDQRRRQQRLAADLVRGDVVEARAALCEQLLQVSAGIDGRQLRGANAEVRSRAKGLRERLADLRERAAAARTGDDVRAVAAAAEDALQRAQQLRAGELARRQSEEEERAEQLRQRQLQDQHDRDLARQHKQLAQAHRAQLQADLRSCQDAARPLERAWTRTTVRPGEDPLQVLAGLRVDGHPLLTYEPPAPPGVGPDGRRRWADAVTHVLTTNAGRTGTWQLTRPTPGGPARFAGTSDSCAALSSWGPATRAVLYETLLQLHAVEDHLADQLAIPARRRRPRPRPDVTAVAGANGTRSPQVAGRPRQLNVGSIRTL